MDHQPEATLPAQTAGKHTVAYRHISEKLATLGRLSAGVAHEINNPAAATQRGAGQLRQVFFELQTSQLQIDAPLASLRVKPISRFGRFTGGLADHGADAL